MSVLWSSVSPVSTVASSSSASATDRPLDADSAPRTITLGELDGAGDLVAEPGHDAGLLAGLGAGEVAADDFGVIRFGGGTLNGWPSVM